MKTALASLLLSVCVAAQADEVLLHGASWHGERAYPTGEWRVGETPSSWEPVLRPYNNANLGVGYLSDAGWAVGVYRNSYYKLSAYISYTRTWPIWADFAAGRPLEAGLSGILVTGYSSQTGNRIQPAVALTMVLPLTERISVKALGAPRVGDGVAVAHLFLGVRY